MSLGVKILCIPCCFICRDVQCIWTDIHELEWYMNLCLYEYVLARYSTGGAPASVGDVVDFFDDVWNSGGDILDDIAEDIEDAVDDVQVIFVTSWSLEGFCCPVGS